MGHAPRKEALQRLEVGEDLWQKAQKRFPIRWPQYYLNLATSEPIARMGRPHESELKNHPEDLSDPIADIHQRPIPFVVRKHRDRVIILTTKRCHFYCRFCFRQIEPVARSGEPGQNDWQAIYQWLEEHPEVVEPILSGGDPLTLEDKALFDIRDRLSAIPSVKQWRIHSRAPVHFPQRMTPELIAGLSRGPKLRVVTHYNHPDEITPIAERIARQMVRAGIEYKNQSVLLAGVNDHTDTQVLLWQQLHDIGISPHYLHHPDRVQGAARFRLSLARGLSIYRGLRGKARSPVPDYVLDLPDGRGKVPICQMEKIAPFSYNYRHPDGSVSIYEDVREPE